MTINDLTIPFMEGEGTTSIPARLISCPPFVQV